MNFELPEACKNCQHFEELKLAIMNYQLELTKERMLKLLEDVGGKPCGPCGICPSSKKEK